MNKNLIYLGGAVLGIGAAVVVFSVLGGDDDGPTVSPVTEPTEAPARMGSLNDPITGEMKPSMQPPEVNKPKEGLEERQALLKRPAADLALRSEVTLKVLAMELKGAGDAALADEINAHVVSARKERYREDLDEEAFVAKVESFHQRASQVQGLSDRGQKALTALDELLGEYR